MTGIPFRSMTDPVPAVTRAILRMEMADGRHVEFEAEHPLGLTCEATTPLRHLPEMDLDSLHAVLPPFTEASQVKIAFQAGLFGSPMVTRLDVAESPQAKLAAIREACIRELGDADTAPLAGELLGILNRAMAPTTSAGARTVR